MPLRMQPSLTTGISSTCHLLNLRRLIPVIYALRNELTLLHVQDYNSGPIYGLDNQYHSMGNADFHVAFGIPASVNAGNGYTSVTEVKTALNCLMKGQQCGSYKPKSTYPNMRGLMTWSINWDQYNGNEFSRNYKAYFQSL